ncbi:MAG: hypothetical protein AAF797_13805 [Planctomycetota bacterium]
MAKHKRYSLENFTEVFRLLNEHGVEHVLCGGFACFLHGVSRVTQDLDICIRLEDENVRAFVEVAKKLGLQTRISEPVDALADPLRRKAWREEKHAVVVSLNTPERLLQVDVFLEYPVSFDELAADMKSVDIAGTRVNISSIEHLIRAKESIDPPRKNDLFDLQELRRLLDE